MGCNVTPAATQQAETTTADPRAVRQPETEVKTDRTETGSMMPEKKALDNYFETFYFPLTQIGVQ
jgi:hypothetical protein